MKAIANISVDRNQITLLARYESKWKLERKPICHKNKVFLNNTYA